MDESNKEQQEKGLEVLAGMGCVTRRKMLLMGGVATATTLLPPGVMDALAQARAKPKPKEPAKKPAPVAMQTSRYPRMKVGKLSALKQDEPVKISYPGEHPNHKALLIKLGVPALGGVGPQKDVVAFSALCVHQGGPLEDRYNAKEKILGPCEFHLSMYDLTKHGVITSASAVQNLPQVMLEVEGDDIYAVGMQGLIYGFPDNLLAV
jgi:arsenite oxidase small subunit